MELALPLIALGGMYIISNQNANAKKKELLEQQLKQTSIVNPQSEQSELHPANLNIKNQQENFTNMGIMSNLATKQSELYGNYLPNSNNPPQNYPITNLSELRDVTNEYPNPNNATDKYFNQNLYQQQQNNGIDVGQNIQNIYSLTGNYLNSDQFKHNNMVPFNGGKVRGYTYNMNNAENILDNMVGAGAQTIKKIEQAPLFKPEENMQWAYGMPNQSDFFQSRVNPGMKANNIKPFDSINVGPGLDQGYSISGSNGFNSGMEARDKWLPKNVDELRSVTNPKLEYNLIDHEGPAYSFIKTPATTQMLGRVEKQRPDTFYINSQDRWFTTTGAMKGETQRAIQETGIIKRPDCEVNYPGPAGSIDVKAGKAPENFEPTKRHQVLSTGVNPSYSAGKGPDELTPDKKNSIINYSNARSTLKQPDRFRSGFSGAVGAVIAPIMDFLAPTKREEYVSNIRTYGDVGVNVHQGYVINPNDKTPTTMKETTLYSPTFNINNQKDGIYINNYNTPLDTQRETTSAEYYNAPGGYASAYGAQSYTSAYRQINNDIKAQTIYNRPNQGGTQLFNQTMNINCPENDCNIHDGRVNPAFSKLSAIPPSTETYGAIHKPISLNEIQNNDYISPDLLNAFRNNPYTQSLTSAV